MTKRIKFNVPICDADVQIIVTNTPSELTMERGKLKDTFGDYTYDRLNACLAYNNKGDFGLFITRKSCTRQILAHEIFHLTHRIDDWISGNFDKDHHEWCALLNDWLTVRIYQILDRWGCLQP